MKKSNEKILEAEAPKLKTGPSKPTINLPRWSSSDPSITTAEPLEVQKNTGWTPSEKPGYKAMNWIFYAFYKWVDYLNNAIDWVKTGLTGYDAEATYAINAVVTYGGASYQSLVAANLGNAVTDATKWACIHSPKTLGITANHTIDNTDGTIIATGSSALTVTLPTAAANYAGRFITAKCLLTGGQVLTIQPATGNIDDKTSMALLNNEAGSFKCDGSSWVLVGKVATVLKTRDITTSQSIGDTDGTIIATGSSDLTVTLPTAAATYTGREVTIKSLLTGEILVTVIAATGTIDGKASITLAGYEAGTFQCDGSKWVLVSKATEGGGSSTLKITSVASAYSILPADVIVKASGATTYAVTLPTSVSGKEFIIKSAMNAGVLLTVNTTSAQTIDGLASLSLARFESVRLVGNGTGWDIVSDMVGAFYA